MEKFRDQSETLVIRAVVPRVQIKEFPSVVAKIEKNRQEGQAYCSVNDVEDLIGIKVLCPYPSDAKEVIMRIRAHPGFLVTPESDEAAQRRKVEGYRGFHFTVRLKEQLLLTNEDLVGVKCEVQVKTMLEESWDAKTHSVTYRREKQIQSELLREMKRVSDELAELDERTEELKGLILEREKGERERKEAAVGILFFESIPRIQEMISKLQNSEKLLQGNFTARNVLSLVPMIQQTREEGKLSNTVCRLAGLVGLYATGRHMDVWAVDVCDDLIRQKPEEPNAYLTKGTIHWALDELDDALEATKIAIERAEARGDLKVVAEGKANFAYWVGEQAWTWAELEPELVERALDNIEAAITMEPSNPAHLDTKGFLLITTGSTKEDIDGGLALVREARRNSSGTSYEKIAQAFYRRHLTIAMTRLSAYQ